MKAIVCGGRDYSNEEYLERVLDEGVKRLGLEAIIEGECPTPINADKLAREWAKKRGIPCEPMPAETTSKGFQGPARNQLMLTVLLRYPHDKAVFAFPGGKGTAHMKKIARAANVRVIELAK